MEIEERLKKSGKKVTPERIKLYEKMKVSHLFESKDLIKAFPEIGRASIFRNIKLFLEIGAIRRVSLGNNSETYEIECCKNCHHEHMKCEDCGEIISFQSNLLYDLIYAEAKKIGFSISSHGLNIFGTCEKCK